MRIKLVLLTSLIAALIGVVLSAAIMVMQVGRWDYVADSPTYRSSSWVELVAYLPVVLTSTLAGIFVYRHTAVRRKFQAIIGFVLVLLYVVALIIAIKLTT